MTPKDESAAPAPENEHPPISSAAAARESRLAAALRTNLRRRKSAGRAGSAPLALDPGDG
jgi:hypothetical protein